MKTKKRPRKTSPERENHRNDTLQSCGKGDFMNLFDEMIERYREEFLLDLNELLSIRSVSAEGEELPRQALRWMLEKADSFGLKTKNIDDIAGHAEYGSGEKLCGVLTHLDVVPAYAEKWSCEPFGLTRKNGRLYGRGVADDKGAALCALYCLRILKECGITGSRIRVIFGTSEEIGMKDMETYFSKEPVPDMSFTPDAEYGICKGEKGIYHLELSCGMPDDSIINRFDSGDANNVVPSDAYVFLRGGRAEREKLEQAAGSMSGSFGVWDVETVVKAECIGKPAHACEPEKGINAAAGLAGLLCRAFDKKYLGGLIAFVDECIGGQTNGESVGIKMSDKESGALSLTLSKLLIEEKRAKAVLDIRYPVTVKGETILRGVRSSAEKYGLEVKVIDEEAPLFLGEDSELMNVLSKAYKTVTGELPELYTTGGGTYARTLGGKGAAFGPVFPDDDSRMHNNDESLDEDKFFRHFRICLEAMSEMIKAD